VRAGKLHVLAIAYAFPPAAAIGAMRPLRIIRRLVEEDLTATVLMGAPHTYRPGMPLDPALLERVPPRVSVVRVAAFRPLQRLRDLRRRGVVRVSSGEVEREAPSAGDSSLIKRLYRRLDEMTTIPDKEAGWILPAFLAGLASVLRQRPDVIYSTAPPWSSQVAALALAKVTRLPWVADFRDPWARAPWRDGQAKLTSRALVFLERLVIKKADAILFATRTNCAEYAAYYGPELGRKFHVVPNGCDPAEFAALSTVPHSERPFVFLHAGSLYGARSPLPLFRALATLIREGQVDAQHVRLRFIGGTTAHDRFEAAASAAGLDRVVEFLPRMRRREILNEMAAASCLLVLQPGTTMSIPGKLYEYLAVGKPVLALSEEGELADLIRESGIGFSVTSDDEVAVMAALQRVMTLKRDSICRVPQHLYDGNLSAADAVAILRKVAGSRRRARTMAPVEPTGVIGDKTQ
jgi:glycosyltransferase involved in cell wall biosynthesis